MIKIAVHGFGRIGRLTVRHALHSGLFTPMAVSDIQDLPTMAALFKADTNYGVWPGPVRGQDNALIVGERSIPYLQTTESLPDWSAMGVDVVIDCTGRATRRAFAQTHLDKGAQRVLVSAVSKSLQDCDAVSLPGINFATFDPRQHFIVSMGSCTTNALAPVIKVLREGFGLEMGFFSTVHAYTNTQALTDQPMKNRRGSWAAAENIIPASSGAAKALKFIWPDLNVTGAYRQHRRVERGAGPCGQRRGSQRRLPECRGAAPPARHHGRAGRRMGLQSCPGGSALLSGRSTADPSAGRTAAIRCRLVRQ